MKNISPSQIQITPLSQNEDLSSFTCNDQDLNEYIQHDAKKDLANFYSATKLVKYQGEIVGFFTLITDTIQMDKVEPDEFPEFEYSKLPGIKIARLATHTEYEKQGVGRYMIIEIFRCVADLTLDVGCTVITVDAKKDAVGFYEKYAFVKAKSKSSHDTEVMYLNVRQLIENNLE